MEKANLSEFNSGAYNAYYDDEDEEQLFESDRKTFFTYDFPLIRLIFAGMFIAIIMMVVLFIW